MGKKVNPPLSAAANSAFLSLYAECQTFIEMAEKELPDIPTEQTLWETVEALQTAVNRAAQHMPPVEDNINLMELPDAVRG